MSCSRRTRTANPAGRWRASSRTRAGATRRQPTYRPSHARRIPAFGNALIDHRSEQDETDRQKQQIDERVEQRKHPELPPAGAPAEIDVVTHTFEPPFHRTRGFVFNRCRPAAALRRGPEPSGFIPAMYKYEKKSQNRHRLPRKSKKDRISGIVQIFGRLRTSVRTSSARSSPCSRLPAQPDRRPHAHKEGRRPPATKTADPKVCRFHGYIACTARSPMRLS